MSAESPAWLGKISLEQAHGTIVAGTSISGTSRPFACVNIAIQYPTLRPVIPADFQVKKNKCHAHRDPAWAKWGILTLKVGATPLPEVATLVSVRISFYRDG